MWILVGHDAVAPGSQHHSRLISLGERSRRRTTHIWLPRDALQHNLNKPENLSDGFTLLR